jgi:hypothetical protein
MYNCAYVNGDIFATISCPAQCRQFAAVPKDEYMNEHINKKPTFRQTHKIQDRRYIHLQF